MAYHLKKVWYIDKLIYEEARRTPRFVFPKSIARNFIGKRLYSADERCISALWVLFIFDINKIKSKNFSDRL